jgi:hypothetical protein
MTSDHFPTRIIPGPRYPIRARPRSLAMRCCDHVQRDGVRLSVCVCVCVCLCAVVRWSSPHHLSTTQIPISPLTTSMVTSMYRSSRAITTVGPLSTDACDPLFTRLRSLASRANATSCTRPTTSMRSPACTKTHSTHVLTRSCALALTSRSQSCLHDSCAVSTYHHELCVSASRRSLPNLKFSSTPFV